ncbi:phosphotransferase family protein [Novosphingobium colocasiae]
MDAEGLDRGPIVDIVPLAGGTQNMIQRFRKGGRTFVLRRPPSYLRANSNDTMLREARLLSALRGTDVPHPELIAVCPDQDVLGAVFYLMEAVEGFNATVGLPNLHASNANIRHQMGLSLVDGLTALERIDHVERGLGDLGRPDGFLQRQVPRWLRQLEGYASVDAWPGRAALPHVDEIATWLETHRPDGFVAGIMHGDYHFANVMFRDDGPELAAIIDWELVTIGDPLLDLGWLLATWPDVDGRIGLVSVEPWNGFPSRHALVERYKERSDRNTEAINWYAILGCFKLAIILEGTFVRACDGAAPRKTGDDCHASAVRLLNRARAWMRWPVIG